MSSVLLWRCMPGAVEAQKSCGELINAAAWGHGGGFQDVAAHRPQGRGEAVQGKRSEDWGVWECHLRRKIVKSLVGKWCSNHQILPSILLPTLPPPPCKIHKYTLIIEIWRRDAWLVQWVAHLTLDLGTVSSVSNVGYRDDLRKIAWLSEWSVQLSILV